MNAIELEEKLQTFLCEHGALDAFEKNLFADCADSLLEHCEHCSENDVEIDAIEHAFSWSGSMEGFDYWRRIDAAWCAHIDTPETTLSEDKEHQLCTPELKALIERVEAIEKRLGMK